MENILNTVSSVCKTISLINKISGVLVVFCVAFSSVSNKIVCQEELADDLTLGLHIFRERAKTYLPVLLAKHSSYWNRQYTPG